MRKFIWVKNGKEVKIGDTLFTVVIENVPIIGKLRTIKEITLTEENLNQFIKKGKVKVIATRKCITIWDKVIKNLIEKTGWKEEKLDNILTNLEKVNCWATTQFILKEIAIELDKKYKDHISESEHIFAISPQDGRVHEIDKTKISSYKAFPAFRTLEEAQFACNLIKKNLKSIFTSV